VIADSTCHNHCDEVLAELGQEIPSRDQQTPEVLAAYQKAEAEKWWPIFKAANIKGE
jgi:hypothetical protein